MEPGQKKLLVLVQTAACLTHTSVNVPCTQVNAGYLFQVVAMVSVELLDVALLVTNHFVQDLDLCLQGFHLLLTCRWNLRKRRDGTGTA